MKKNALFITVAIFLILASGYVGYQSGKSDPRDFQVAINVGRMLGAAEANAKEHGRFTAAYPWGVDSSLLKDPVNPFTQDAAFVSVLIEAAENPGDMAYIGDPGGQHCVVAARLSTGKVVGSYSKLN